MSRRIFLGLLLLGALPLPSLFVGCSRDKEDRENALEAAKLLLESTLPVYLDITRFEGKYTRRSATSLDGIVRFKAAIQATEDLYETKVTSPETRQLLADVEAGDRQASKLVGGSPEIRSRLEAELKKLREDVKSLTTLAVVVRKGETQEIFGTATVSSHPRTQADKLELERKLDIGKPFSDFTGAVRAGTKEETEARAEIAKQLASVKNALLQAKTEMEQIGKGQEPCRPTSDPGGH